jgi:hypothetical protein
MSTSMIKVTEDGSTIMSEDLLKVASGAYEVSVIFQLNLSHLQIHSIQALGCCSMLTTLDLSHNRIASLGAPPAGDSGKKAAAKPSGSALPGGFITHSSVKEGSPAPLDGICAVAETLLHLDLSHNCLTDISVLVHFRRLQSLKVQGNRIAALDTVVPLGSIATLRTLQLQAFDLQSDQNPCCTSVSRAEYCKVMAKAFTTVRCLDGHYFCKDAVDPSFGDLIGQDFEIKLPEPKPWFSEKALQSLTSNLMDAPKCGVMTEKAVYNATADAKKTVEAAKRAFGV